MAQLIPPASHARLSVRLLVLALLLLALLALAAIWPASQPASASVPLQTGPTSSGAALYQQNCAPCHGATGAGDGPTAADLPAGATALADPAVARVAAPADWFQVIKEGRMDRFMPPWKNRMTDAQIWDVTAYALSLHVTPAQSQQGQAIWGAQCASCHGVAGAGDGAQAAADGLTVPTLTDFTQTAAQSLDAWRQIIVAGKGKMPAFPQLSEDEQWAVAAYARSLSAPSVGSSTTMPKGQGRLTGVVSNGTTNAVVTGITVTLRVFENFNELAPMQAPVDAAGRFAFDALPTGDAYAYLLTAPYNGDVFGSNIASFTAGQNALDVPLAVYERSNTPGQIRVALAQWFIEPHQGALLVGELYRITHDSTTVYTGSDDVAPGKKAVLRFTLPPGATSLVLDGGEVGDRFVLTSDGVADTQPLIPGGTQILLRYLLPYSGDAADFSHAVPYPVDSLNVLVAAGPQVSTDLQSLGEQTVAQQQWNSYQGANIAAGQPVRLQLADLAAAAAAASPATSTAVLAYNPTLLYAIGGFAFVLALGILAAYALRRNRNEDGEDEGEAHAAPASPDANASRDSLLDAIAQLDDQHAAGELDEEDYQRTRAAYKRRLLLADLQAAPAAPVAPQQDESQAS